MGVVIPQLAPASEDRASGAQVIDGSLKFDASSYLRRTPSVDGNRKIATLSFWMKQGDYPLNPFNCTNSSDSNKYFTIESLGTGYYRAYSLTIGVQDQYSSNGTPGSYRDMSGWYHMVVKIDNTQSAYYDRVRIYINGVDTGNAGSSNTVQNSDGHLFAANTYHDIRMFSVQGSAGGGYLSQFYGIDGQALGPEYFGYTDPLTNTWRPKKFDINKTPSGSWGTNGFYLPLDGNSLIGEDKSGNGNDWTPVNFGGSNTIEKATGALPILNTVSGGKVATAGVRTDAYASSLVLALPLVGIKSDFSNAVNSGTSNKAITANGNAAASSTQSNFYGGSFAFDGSGDYLTVAENSDLLINGTECTIEGWYYVNSSFAGFEGSSLPLFAQCDVANGSTSGTANFWSFADATYLYFGSSQGQFTVSKNVIPIGRWFHYAAVVTGTTNGKLFIDGVEVGSGTIGAIQSGSSRTTNLGIIRSGGGGGASYLNGYIQDFRIYKGVAKYTSNFIPASTNPDILPDTPSGVAGGSALTKITEGAVAFDGTNDGLTISDNADFDLGTNDFTIEGYYYLENAGTYQCLFDWRGGSNGVYPAMFRNDTGDYIYYFVDSARRIDNIAITYKKWFHLALCRSSGTTRLFIDGVEKGSFADSFNYISNDINLGLSPGNTNDLTGFISNYRVVNGTALYTSNFTPPSAPLTNVTNTKLLCCQDTTAFVNGGQPILNTNSTGTTTTSGTRHDPYASNIVLALAMNGSNGGTTFTDIHPTIKGSGSAKTITVNGNSQTSTAQSKYYGSSGYFDGTGDSLDVASSSDYNVTTNYTVEAWVYFDSLASNTYFLGVESSYWIAYDSTGIGGAANKLTFTIYNGSSWQAVNSTTTPVTGRWYHIAAVKEGTSLYFFLDGVKENTTTMSGSPYNAVDFFNVAKWNQGGTALEGYLQDIRVYTATAKYTSDFKVTAPTVDVPAAVTPGSITANGNAAATNFNPFTTDINTVRGQETGYPTYLPFGNDTTYSEGNLRMVTADPGYGRNTQVNTAITLGQKFFFEFTVNSDGSSSDVTIGIDDGASWSTYTYASNGSSDNLDADFRGYRSAGGTFVGATYTSGSPGISYNDGDVIGLAIDRVNHQNQYYKNGILVYTHSISSTVQNYYPCIQTWTGAADVVLNSGQKPFKFPPPEGFKTLCLANLPTPTSPAAVRPDKYFKTVLYTGTGASLDVSGVGFQPDFVWSHRRDLGSDHHLFDVVRGVTKGIFTNDTKVEETNAQFLTSFNRDGFTLGTNGGINASSGTHVAWCWKAGGAAVSNSDGSITSQVSANQDAGFSIVSYTGTGASATVGHGLGVAPKMVIVKRTDDITNWPVWFEAVSAGGSKFVQLNLTTAEVANSTFFDGASTTSTTFPLGSGAGQTNASGADHIAYCFAEVKGYSKFGSYTGNGNADGPFIHCGFKPAWVMVKKTNATDSWLIMDSTRSTYNAVGNTLAANSSGAENADTGGIPTDFLSNGFKCRGTGGDFNASGSTYIFAAFAEAPTNNLFGGQANAR